jgi:hypothetical protein
LNAGAWVVPRGVSGPFTSQSTVPVAAAEEISGGGHAPGEIVVLRPWPNGTAPSEAARDMRTGRALPDDASASDANASVDAEA